MTRDELKQLMVGPVQPVITAYDGNDRVDPGAIGAVTEHLIAGGVANGVTVLKPFTMGEQFDLAPDEWPVAVGAAVRAAAGRAPIVCGIKPQNTPHTVDDVKRAADVGAIGVQLDTPWFMFPTQENMVRYLADISAAVDVGIMVVNAYWWKAPSLDRDSLCRLADAEHVVAMKWAVPDDADYDLMAEFSGTFSFIDNSGQPVRAHKNGATGYVDNLCAVYPPHGLKVWGLCEEHRYDEAQAEYARVAQAMAPFHEKYAGRSGGTRLTRGMLELLGLRVGAPRAPVIPLRPDEVADLRVIMQSLGLPVQR